MRISDWSSDVCSSDLKQAIVLTAQNEDSIGNDPVKANAVWVGGDYLNVSFMFNYGGSQPHAVNLVKNSLSSGTSEDVIALEFHHNSYGKIGRASCRESVCQYV